jgi:Raf kinase inhibitor-like YbhB/YbcL family protein
MNLTVTSAAFGPGQPIPARYTGEGDDISPHLEWSGGPVGTRTYALICDDPDAPTPQPWVHWLLYALPANVTSLPDGASGANPIAAPFRGLEGLNSWPNGRTIGYRGPMPPRGHGVHHYHFKVYALDEELKLSAGLSKEELLAAIEPHVLATGEYIGTYERK